jgi:NAD(P)-dependent dehydrogenase (short-subunit alcohol dehydrogenase family)
MPAILITGVSTGIGYGAAKAFVSAGYRVFGSVRKPEDAQRLATEMGENFTPVLFDVTDTHALTLAAQQVSEQLKGQGLVGLINNAGIATSGPLIHQSLDEIRWQFEVNVIAPIAVIQSFLPLLRPGKAVTSQPVRIINISSIAGKISAPFLGAYAGSKHALEGMSNSLRRELQLQGIDVIVIAPGPINTAIWDKESALEMSQYATTEYAEPMRAFQQFMVKVGKAGYSSEKVGQFIYRVFEAKHPKTRYTITPDPYANWYLPQWFPPRWLDRMIGKSVGLLPK